MAGRADAGQDELTAPSATEFVFIRHGQTDWNLEHRFQGQSDPPLNETGRRQAARLAQRLAPHTPDRLVSSDLLRARQTAEPLAQAWGLQPLLREGLREQSFGAMEGLRVPEVQSLHPEIWSHWLQASADFSLPGGGESHRQFSARILADVDALAQTYPGQRLVVVTHGGVLDMLWRAVQQLPLDGLRACEIPNTGINRLQWDQGRLTLLQWGDAEHLADMPFQPQTGAPLR
jgi:2,3-bisphosphoglycerate-dependent phosphoglycerate mutase